MGEKFKDAATPDLKDVGHPSSKPDATKNAVRFGTGKYGNTDEYAIAKLRKDAPAIHQRVLDAELSPHAGMIEAGFRNKRASRKLKPFDQIRTQCSIARTSRTAKQDRQSSRTGQKRRVVVFALSRLPALDGDSPTET